MGIFSKLFSSTNPGDNVPEPILVDMHSHLLPGIDDGVKSIEESVSIIREFVKLGFKKLITTPHIMGDFYRNTPDIILSKLALVKARIAEEGIDIQLEAAAEYYLDESLINKLQKEEKLLTFGENYLLIETSYLNEPSNFAEAIALIKQSGYWPVLAHPERYQYLYRGFEKFEEIYALDISFQLNTNSLIGYYSKPAQMFAEKLIEKNMIHFIGSDCHSMKHIVALQKTMKLKEYNKLSRLYLFNNALLNP